VWRLLTPNQTDNGFLFFEGVLKRVAEFGVPLIGLNLIMGEDTKDKITNLLDGL
jgi:hypothetical protein